ncbi:MAG: type II toxin-antitoxin system VapC family toxin [Candidatus Njordarchaeum guaymaensis]
MDVFIDTGIFVALRNADDVNHHRAVRLMRKILSEKHNRIYTSNFVFNEAVTVALVRTKRIDVAVDIGNYILSSRKIRIIHVDHEIFRLAWNIFQKYSDKALSFTDASILAIMKKYGITYLMTFDSRFQGIVPIVQQ